MRILNGWHIPCMSNPLIKYCRIFANGMENLSMFPTNTLKQRNESNRNLNLLWTKNKNGKNKTGLKQRKTDTELPIYTNWKYKNRYGDCQLNQIEPKCHTESLESPYIRDPPWTWMAHTHTHTFRSTALLSQVLLVRYNTIEASALCNCIFLAQYPSLYFRFNCHGHRTKAHVSILLPHCHSPTAQPLALAIENMSSKVAGHRSSVWFSGVSYIEWILNGTWKGNWMTIFRVSYTGLNVLVVGSFSAENGWKWSTRNVKFVFNSIK